MYPAERQAEIVRIAVERDGDVTTADLVERLGVTAETVRRDLAALQRRGQITRRRAGAIVIPEPRPFEPTLAQRQGVDVAERARIAARVVAEFPADGTLLLDSGSMAIAVAEAIPENLPLVVVTNNLPAAALLARHHRRVTVFTLPGQVRRTTQGVVGAWAQRLLLSLRADVAVLGANGLSVDAGASTTLPEEAAIKRAMMSAAARRIVASTSGKVGHDSLCQFAALTELDVIVTDTQLPHTITRRLAAAGPEVITV